VAKLRRKDLEQFVSAVEATKSLPPRQSPKQKGPGGLPKVDDALAKAIEGIPGLTAFADAAKQIEAKRGGALRQYVEESRAAAGKNAASLLGHRGVLDDQAPEPVGIAPEIEPSLPVEFIRTSPGGRLGEQQIADGDTWAKWDSTVESGSIGTTTTEWLSFFFLWHNPRKRNLRVDITSGFSMRGHMDVHAEGNGFPASLFFPDGRVDIDVRARMTVWPLWLPNTPQPYQSLDLATLDVSASTFSHSEAAAVAANPAMQQISYFVPRDAYLLIETGIVADFSVYQGTGKLDFASADAFRADFPYCFVTQG